MKILAVIPARYASTRLPGKPLLFLGNKTLIQRVYENIVSFGIFHEVIVGTDDKRIFEHVKSFGGKVVMTSSSIRSGTDRVYEVTKNSSFDIIFNIQGDEPFLDKKILNDVRKEFSDDDIEVVSSFHRILHKKEIENPNNVKVVMDREGFALYFSRSVIPYNENGSHNVYYKHLGIYAFRKSALERFVKLPISELEKTEKLEQLRMLENSIKIKMVESKEDAIGIDTIEDLQKAREFLPKTPK